MRPRQDLVESFSTFLQFEGDRPQTWSTDPRLRRSMVRHLEETVAADSTEISSTPAAEQQPEQASFWALYWHQHWQATAAKASEAAPLERRGEQSRSIAANHLNAYVQEGCYWAAKKTATRFNYGISDCFQMAIAEFHKILRGFNPGQGADFAAYANATFASLIRETLRQRQEVDICTPWGLLRKLSKKRLRESLQRAGFGDNAVAQHLLVWQAFKLHYVPEQAQGTRKLPKPEAAQITAMATFYNQERAAQLSLDTPKLPVDAIEPMLLAMAQAGRAYLYPAKVSINAQKSGQDSEFIDDLTETDTLPPLEAMVNREEVTERRQQRSQLVEVIQTAIEQLDEPAQQLLGFYYRDQLTQTEMAARLNIQQYTVSRRLTKIRKTLVKTLVQWSEAQLHTSLEADLLTHISSLLEEWLQQHYSDAA